MIPELRAAFNSSWTDAQYRDLIARLEMRTGAIVGLPDQRDAVLPAAIVDGDAGVDRPHAHQSDSRQRLTRWRRRTRPCPKISPSTSLGQAAPAPRRSRHSRRSTSGWCVTPDGSITPKLVELQAFASLYGFQLADRRSVSRRVQPALVARSVSRRPDGRSLPLARRGGDRRRSRSRRGGADGDPAASAEDVAGLRGHRAAVGRARRGHRGGDARRSSALLPARWQASRRSSASTTASFRTSSNASASSCHSDTATTSTWSGPGIRRGISA